MADKAPEKLRMTAREMLEAFYPDHAMHTVMKVVTINKDVVEFDCSCGEFFGIPKEYWEPKNFTLDDFKIAFRNVISLFESKEVSKG